MWNIQRENILKRPITEPSVTLKKEMYCHIILEGLRWFQMPRASDIFAFKVSSKISF